MNRKRFPSISYTGMLLTIISVLMAAASTKNEDKKVNDGNLAITTNGGEYTCVPGSLDVCTATAPLPCGCVYPGTGSRTTIFPYTSSYISTIECIDKVATLTEGVGWHTSAGPA